MNYEIQLLEKEKWQGHEVYFSDFADNAYAVNVEHEANGFAVSITKEPLEERRIIKYPQKLFTYASNNVKTGEYLTESSLSPELKQV
jgi:nucleoid-associated protein YejK